MKAVVIIFCLFVLVECEVEEICVEEPFIEIIKQTKFIENTCFGVSMFLSIFIPTISLVKSSAR